MKTIAIFHEKAFQEVLLRSWTQKDPSTLPTITLIALSVEIILHFGGCCRLDLLMKPLLNFFDARNVIILGEIIHDYTDNFCNGYR